jgi:hypothetical protein
VVFEGDLYRYKVRLWHEASEGPERKLEREDLPKTPRLAGNNNQGPPLWHVLLTDKSKNSLCLLIESLLIVDGRLFSNVSQEVH